MKKVILFTFVFLLFCSESFCQLLCPPNFVHKKIDINRIIVHEAGDNKALLIYTSNCDVYERIGAIICKSVHSSNLRFVKLICTTANYSIVDKPFHIL